MSWRNPELEALFGGPLDENGITEAAILRLIAARARESEFIDFKMTLAPAAPPTSTAPVPPASTALASPTGPSPAPISPSLTMSPTAVAAPAPVGSWSAKLEFAKDVATFANHRGGILLYGVAEAKGAASAAIPMSVVPDRQELAFRQGLVNHQTPLARTEFVWIPAAKGGYYLAVVVPPSRRAPHAVTDSRDLKKPLWFPVRHGNGLNWMTESEVEAAYGRRFRGQAAAQDRASEVVRVGKADVVTAEGLWLFAAVSPEAPMNPQLTEKLQAEIEQWKGFAGIHSPTGAISNRA